MNSNKNTDVLAGSSFSFLLSVTLFFLVFYGIAIYVLAHRDVKA